MEKEINQEFNNPFKKILIIAVFIVIVIIVITVLLTIFKGKPETSLKSNGGKINSLEGTLEEKLKLCLEKEELDVNCEKLFTDPERYKDCENLGELRDKCLYRIAINGRLYLCEYIKNEELKNKCNEGFLFLVEE